LFDKPKGMIMKSIATPWTHTAVLRDELRTTCKGRDVVVPAGTVCHKLDGGSVPWVVGDLSFIEDKNSILYHDADHYGIRVPEDAVKDIFPAGLSRGEATKISELSNPLDGGQQPQEMALATRNVTTYFVTHGLGRADMCTPDADAIAQKVNAVTAGNGNSLNREAVQKELDSQANPEIQSLYRLTVEGQVNEVEVDEAENRVHAEMDQSFEEAQVIACKDVLAEPLLGSKFYRQTCHGPVLGVTDHHVVQSLGKIAIIHEKSSLDRVPEKGDVLTISYDGRGGLGKVSAKEQGKGVAR
jgi:hypothetical protein